MIYILFVIIFIGIIILLGWGGVNYHQIENDLRKGIGAWRKFW